MSFDKNSEGTRQAYKSLSSKIANYRADLCDEVLFTEEDRAQQSSEKKRK
jgi:hypothetical protein